MSGRCRGKRARQMRGGRQGVGLNKRRESYNNKNRNDITVHICTSN